MTTTKTPIVTNAVTDNPTSLAETIATLLFITIIVAFPLQNLFNAFIANTYHVTELTFKLSVLLMAPFVLIYYWINKMFSSYMINHNVLMNEQTLIRQYNHYILEYNMRIDMKMDYLLANIPDIDKKISEKVDTEQKIT